MKLIDLVKLFNSCTEFGPAIFSQCRKLTILLEHRFVVGGVKTKENIFCTLGLIIGHSSNYVLLHSVDENCIVIAVYCGAIFESVSSANAHDLIVNFGSVALCS